MLWATLIHRKLDPACVLRALSFGAFVESQFFTGSAFEPRRSRSLIRRPTCYFPVFNEEKCRCVPRVPTFNSQDETFCFCRSPLMWTNPKFGYRPLSCFQALNFIAIFETFYTFFVRTWTCFKGLNWRLERSVSRLIRGTRIQSHNGPIMRPIPSPFPLPPPSLPHSTLWQC